MSYDSIDLERTAIDPRLAQRIPARLALRRKVLPLAIIDGVAFFAAENPDEGLEDTLRRTLVNIPVKLLLAEAAPLRKALEKTYGALEPLSLTQTSTSFATQTPQDNAAPLLDSLLAAAITRKASDIHIDPSPDFLSVRFRADGHLELFQQYPLQLLPALASRLKVLSNLDITERRLPQDGRFPYNHAGVKMDIRIATMPTRHGEKITLRIMGSSAADLDLAALGLHDSDLQLLRTAFDQPHGIILVTGPTGSGKTTTLYAALNTILRTGSDNIITIEDPVEYELPGITQVSIDAAERFAFKDALKATLRHDPDTIMIGEIRDEDVAATAIRASITGHLVLSTLHTNSAPGAVTRLIDMGVAPYLLAASLRLVIAQRLVRRLCPQCRQPVQPNQAHALILDHLKMRDITLYKAAGCLACAGSGYIGRTGIFEILTVDHACAELIRASAPEDQLFAHMRSQGHLSLQEDALRKLRDGQVSLESLLELALLDLH